MSIPPISNGAIVLKDLQVIRGCVPKTNTFKFSIRGDLPEKGKKYVFGFDEIEEEIVLTTAIIGDKADEIATKVKQIPPGW